MCAQRRCASTDLPVESVELSERGALSTGRQIALRTLQGSLSAAADGEIDAEDRAYERECDGGKTR